MSTEDSAVLDALGDSFEARRLFLHPEQHRLATTSFKGSANVTGGPGTGKTVVALHRVRHLIDRLPPGQTQPVLLTTYNTNLAADLRKRLHRLGGDTLVRRVDVRSVDQLAREVVEQHPGSVLAYTLACEPFLIPASEIGREGPRDVDTVHIGTMHRCKGLESSVCSWPVSAKAWFPISASRRSG